MKPKAWREQLGLDQEQMSAFVGVHGRAWYKYETGLAVPSIDLIVRFEQLSEGNVTAHSWFELSLSLLKRPPGRFYGQRRNCVSQAHAARA